MILIPLPAAPRWCRAVAFAVPLVAGCAQDDPRLPMLHQAVMQMEAVVRSEYVADAVRKEDPAMRASTAARVALGPGAMAPFPRLPSQIALGVNRRMILPWGVRLVGDDAAREVRVEGYAAKLDAPEIVARVPFPPPGAR